MKKIDYKNLIKLILIFILFCSNRYFKLLAIKIFNLDIKNINSNTSMLLSIFSSLCILTILLIVYRKDLLNNYKKLKKNFYKTMDTSLKYYLLGIGLMLISNLIINIVFSGNGANNEKLVQNMIDTSPFLMFINAGFIAPIIEELVFRKTYMDTFKNKWVFLILSSLIFGLMHVITSSNYLYEYLYLIPYASLGFGLAYMDYKEKSILPSIIFHICHNSILILLSIAL